MKSSVWSAECTWACLGGSDGAVPYWDLYARWRKRCRSLSALIRVNRCDLFSRALGIRSTKKVWKVSLFSLYILRRACFMDTIFALIFVLALILLGWFFEDACPYVMGSRSEHNRISKSSIIAGSSQGESRRRGCRYWSPSMLSSCFLTVLSWWDPPASDCKSSAVGYHFWSRLRPLSAPHWEQLQWSCPSSPGTIPFPMDYQYLG